MTVETALQKARLVVAGNFAEFRDWQYSLVGKDTRTSVLQDQYVLSARDLVFRDPDKYRVIYVGRYHMRGDLRLVREEIARHGFDVSYGE